MIANGSTSGQPGGRAFRCTWDKKIYVGIKAAVLFGALRRAPSAPPPAPGSIAPPLRRRRACGVFVTRRASSRGLRGEVSRRALPPQLASPKPQEQFDGEPVSVRSQLTNAETNRGGVCPASDMASLPPEHFTPCDEGGASRFKAPILSIPFLQRPWPVMMALDEATGRRLLPV